MKEKKTRRPSTGPFASPYSDIERKELIDDADSGQGGEAVASRLSSEFERAIKKTAAAQRQLGGDLNEAAKFADAQRSASSATATSESMLPAMVKNATVGLKHRASQTRVARKLRGAAFNRVFARLLLPKYAELTNKELWGELISLSGTSRLSITEISNPLSLEWEDDETGKHGTLLFSSFGPKLAELRAARGQLKRGRKKLV